ncbi:MAG TPA: hypothetical protein PKV96_02720 [Candidatus Saccharimonas sp.]|nr:hypothetical protein [Candidatus Saccharimonas sp.]
MTRRRLIIGVTVALILIGGGIAAVVMLNTSKSGKDVQNTDLRSVNKDEMQSYVDQLSAKINGLPSNLTPATVTKLENQLGYVLREKYGANTLVGDMRGDVLTDVYDVSTLYIDIKAKNETYLASFKNDGSDVSIFCAPQDMQINPQTSQCVTIPADDSYQFEKG